jgi:hypothetical protein
VAPATFNYLASRLHPTLTLPLVSSKSLVDKQSKKNYPDLANGKFGGQHPIHESAKEHVEKQMSDQRQQSNQTDQIQNQTKVMHTKMSRYGILSS